MLRSDRYTIYEETSKAVALKTDLYVFIEHYNQRAVKHVDMLQMV